MTSGWSPAEEQTHGLVVGMSGWRGVERGQLGEAGSAGSGGLTAEGPEGLWLLPGIEGVIEVKQQVTNTDLHAQPVGRAGASGSEGDGSGGQCGDSGTRRWEQRA